MLLTEMPARPNAPEPKRAIAFDQAIRARMEELGLGEAGLVIKYANLLKVKPELRRSLVIKTLKGETDPQLRTVFNLLHPKVLDGELFLRWTDSNDLELLPSPEILSQVIQQRMAEVGLNPVEPSAIYELTRRYCHLKSADKPLNPSNNIKVIKHLIADKPNSRLQTVATVAQALKGQLLTRWRKTIRQVLPAESKAAYAILEDLPAEETFIVEYQKMDEGQEIRRG